MKKLLLVAALQLWCVQKKTFAQNRSNVWELSYQLFVPDCGLDFSSGSPDTFSVWRNLDFFNTNASICDTTGQILFYTNGQWIANRDDDTLMNSEQFNPGWATDTFYSSGGGLGFEQGAIGLPDPGDSSSYYLFYITTEWYYHVDEGLYDDQPFHLSYSKIKMSLDNGLGGIPNGMKNVYAIEDTLWQGRITACKHANGRDWWIISHKHKSDKFYIVLVSSEGVSPPLEQSIGDTLTEYYNYNGFIVDTDNAGQACFSPDGTHYAFVDFLWNVYLFDFDRCTGTLSNFRKDSIGCLDESLCVTLGCSFSPNSRYLYVNTYQRIFQYDLEAMDFASSRVQVATVDSFGFPYIGYFFINQLAPDNKIYLGSWNGIEALHVIDQPDSPGVACDVVQHGLVLPTWSSSVPNFPNYDLGALPGSPCDTVYTTNDTQITDHVFRFYPNPASKWLNIVYNLKDDALFELFDLYGRKVAAVSLYNYFKNRTLDVSGLSEGVYAYSIRSKNTVLQNGKLAVVK
ncbi:MAG: T9SS type A sorting domain-containing protein [Chitinophagales bacterium]|nr:T9SS type A sorting domain-containing protein [Chitinophagales bacterium]